MTLETLIYEHGYKVFNCTENEMRLNFFLFSITTHYNRLINVTFLSNEIAIKVPLMGMRL